jgi:hypothetical protein
MSQPLAVVFDFALAPDTLRWSDLTNAKWNCREVVCAKSGEQSRRRARGGVIRVGVLLVVS